MTLSKEQKREIARRLENWSRWYWGGGRGAGGSPFPAYNLVNASSVRESSHSIPVMMGEAEDTDRILRAMHPEHTKALIVHYLSRGTPKDRARRCRCKVVRTYHRRVERAEAIFNRRCFPSQRQERNKEISLVP